MILYHGSYLEICKPDLVHSRRNVDFGQGKLENETNFKKKADYALYKEIAENPVSKLKFYKNLIEDFKTELMDKIAPLLV